MPDASKFTHGYALLVGVGRYKERRLSVPVTARDAEDLQRFLIDPRFCAYPEDQVVALTNEHATQTRILAEMEAIRERVKRDAKATVLIFFSGHGWQQEGYHFLPYETETVAVAGRLQVKPDTALANEDFLARVRQISAQRLVMLFDTCFAGGVGTALSPELEQLAGFAPVPLGLYDPLLEGSGRVVISSSQADERSWIKGGAANSLFTVHLLAGLQGQGIPASQDTVRILDLFSHLSVAVPADARTIGASQTPVLKAYDVTQNFPVALLLGGSGRSLSAGEPLSTTRRYNTANIRRLLSEALTDEELDFMCMDYFPRTYEQFSAGMSKSQKTHRLLEHCLRHNQFEHLLELVREANPARFAEYEDKLRN